MQLKACVICYANNNSTQYIICKCVYFRIAFGHHNHTWPEKSSRKCGIFYRPLLDVLGIAEVDTIILNHRQF